MSGVINPKAYRFKAGVAAILGWTPESYSEQADPTFGYRVMFRAEAGHDLTFQQLNQLSELLGTDEINFTTGREGYRYSSWTYDDGSPPDFDCRNCKVK